MTLISDAATTRTPTIEGDSRVQLSPAAPSLWRVIAAGRIIGHLQALADDAGVRYRARRFHPGSRSFRDLGDFWTAADAIDCLRFAR
ncbi:MAG: hypothetical protein ABW024_02720 [Microbacterium sp.]